MELKPFYTQETAGIRITVRPIYILDYSLPHLGHFMFAYFVRIENTSRRTVQLLTRHWHIVDSNGDTQDVDGEGVVGEQPILPPGGVHEYNSYCVLKSPRGYMEGSYTFIGRDDVLTEATVPRFELVADEL